MVSWKGSHDEPPNKKYEAVTWKESHDNPPEINPRYDSHRDKTLEEYRRPPEERPSDSEGGLEREIQD